MGKTITVDDEVHKTLKIESAKSGEDIKDIVSEVVDECIGVYDES